MLVRHLIARHAERLGRQVPRVAPEVFEQAAEHEADVPGEGDAQQHADAAERNGDVVAQPAQDELPQESVGDATQEFRVEHGDWLEDDDEV